MGGEFRQNGRNGMEKYFLVMEQWKGCLKLDLGMRTPQRKNNWDVALRIKKVYIYILAQYGLMIKLLLLNVIK